MEEGVRDIMQSVRDGLAGETRLPERLLLLVRSHLKTLLGPRFDALAQRMYTMLFPRVAASGRGL
jgi:hypothetical protein